MVVTFVEFAHNLLSFVLVGSRDVVRRRRLLKNALFDGQEGVKERIEETDGDRFALLDGFLVQLLKDDEIGIVEADLLHNFGDMFFVGIFVGHLLDDLIAVLLES